MKIIIILKITWILMLKKIIYCICIYVKKNLIFSTFFSLFFSMMDRMTDRQMHTRIQTRSHKVRADPQQHMPQIAKGRALRSAIHSLTLRPQISHTEWTRCITLLLRVTTSSMPVPRLAFRCHANDRGIRAVVLWPSECHVGWGCQQQTRTK